jgi:hypothetical protein
MPPCSQCQTERRCDETCQAYAELLRQCAQSGQMSPRQVHEHVQAGEMPKHPDCAQECQQAVDYGVWPERSCSPRCVWLSRAATPLPTHPHQEQP